ncbi:MAG: hypothetical protein PVH46_07430 [Granulosicoccaceae bacterium]|jgi:hypothetical protein
MNEPWLNPLIDALHETALIVAYAGSLFAIAVGLLLILTPAVYLRTAQTLNVWISTRRGMKQMEIPRPQERHFYRHHRLFGLLICVGAVYTLYYFLLEFDRANTSQNLQQIFTIQPIYLDWLLDAGSLILVISNLLVLVVGVIIMIRPSLLKHIEAWGNRWISTRHATYPLDYEFHGLDHLTARHPRGMGILLLLGGVYVLGVLTFYLI